MNDFSVSEPPMSDWFPLSAMPPVPHEPGLIIVRATRNGEPVHIEHPKRPDPEGTLYIKACDDLFHVLYWLYHSLHNPNFSPVHPAAKIYHETELAQELYPLEGLQFCYI